MALLGATCLIVLVIQKRLVETHRGINHRKFLQIRKWK